MTAFDIHAGQRICARCGAAFACAAPGPGPCWCTDLPPLPRDRLEAGQGCVCETCLRERLRLGQGPGR